MSSEFHHRVCYSILISFGVGNNMLLLTVVSAWCTSTAAALIEELICPRFDWNSSRGNIRKHLLLIHDIFYFSQERWSFWKILEIENTPEIDLWSPSFQCGNMAREGLRTLVVAKKCLSEEQYQDFEVCRNTLVSVFCVCDSLFLFLQRITCYLWWVIQPVSI